MVKKFSQLFILIFLFENCNSQTVKEVVISFTKEKNKSTYVIVKTDGEIISDEYLELKTLDNSQNLYSAKKTDMSLVLLKNGEHISKRKYEYMTLINDEILSAGIKARLSNKWFYIDPDGVEIDTNEYDQISYLNFQHTSDEISKYSRLIVFYKEKKINIAFYEKSLKKLVFISKEWFDSYEDINDFIVLTNGDKKAIYKLTSYHDEPFILLKNFEKCFVYFNQSNLFRHLKQQKIVEVYDLQGNLIKKIPNRYEKPDDLIGGDENTFGESNFDWSAPSPTIYEYNDYSVANLLNEIKNGNKLAIIDRYRNLPNRKTLNIHSLSDYGNIRIYSKDNKFGMYSANRFNVKIDTIPPIYDTIIVNNSGKRQILAIVLNKGKYGLIDLNGTCILPISNSKITFLDDDITGRLINVIDKKNSYFLFFDNKNKKFDTLLNGNKTMQFNFNSGYLHYSQIEKKKKKTGCLIIDFIEEEEKYIVQKNTGLQFDSIIKDPFIPFFNTNFINGKFWISNPVFDTVVAYGCTDLKTLYGLNYFINYFNFNKTPQKFLKPTFLYKRNGEYFVSTVNLEDWLFTFKEYKLNNVQGNLWEISENSLLIINKINDEMMNVYNYKGDLLTKEPVKYQNPSSIIFQMKEDYWYFNLTELSGKIIAIDNFGNVFKSKLL